MKVSELFKGWIKKRPRYRARVRFFYFTNGTNGHLVEWPVMCTRERRSKRQAYWDARRLVESAMRWGLYSFDDNLGIEEGFDVKMPSAIQKAKAEIEECTE